MTNPVKVGLDAAKEAVGGRAYHLAKALKVNPGTVSKWKGTIPLHWIESVEKATGVPRHLLRPDFFQPRGSKQ